MGSAPTESLYCLYQSMAAAASSSRLCWVAASCFGQAASDSQGRSAWTTIEALQPAGHGLGRSANCCYLCALPPLSKGHGSGHGSGHGQDAGALQEPRHVPSSSNPLFSQWHVPAPYLRTLMVRREAAHHRFCSAGESCPQVNTWPSKAGSAQAEPLTVLGVKVDCRLHTSSVHCCGMVP